MGEQASSQSKSSRPEAAPSAPCCLLAPPSLCEVCPASSAPAKEVVPSPIRTSTHAPFRSKCAQRGVAPADESAPVKLVVFDLDETLTLLSYMIEEGDSEEVVQEILDVCFETPWVNGSRLTKLRKMLEDLRTGPKGERIHLAILTRNSAGAKGVLRLLQAADLARFFCAIWTLPWRVMMENGAYWDGKDWVMFDPPIKEVPDHKANVLLEASRNPSDWFPQLVGGIMHGELGPIAAELASLRSMTIENIVLVDDQRSNFQSVTGAQVKRYCKVARYDSTYRDFGLCKNMGGIGAHSDADYATLLSFVASPAMCRETLELYCVERWFPQQRARPPVSLIVFDLDETLTLATFMPQDSAFAASFDWDAAALSSGEWSKADLVEYNFESPFVQGGGRLGKLRRLLGELTVGKEGRRRALTVLSRNSDGVIAVVNLLKMAGLDHFFSAVWIMRPLKGERDDSRPSGAFREGRIWRCFDAPVARVPDQKSDVLRDIVANPRRWFPQLEQEGSTEGLGDLLRLSPASVVHVDDERAAFQSRLTSGVQALRYCKVARYDADYRLCGHLNQMGGIGAHDDSDYDTLKSFVERPWEFLQDERPPGALDSDALSSGADVVVVTFNDDRISARSGASGTASIHEDSSAGGDNGSSPGASDDRRRLRKRRQNPSDEDDKMPRRRKSLGPDRSVDLSEDSQGIASGSIETSLESSSRDACIDNRGC